MQPAVDTLKSIWVYLVKQIYPMLVLAFIAGATPVKAQWEATGCKVPRIDIDIEKGHTVASRNHYLNATFKITGHGTYKDFAETVQIKGRGNNSWNYAKKSYRLKFTEKVKLFGLKKGKSWVLLANPQHGSMIRISSGFTFLYLISSTFFSTSSVCSASST
jgi:hypothetical protein